MPLESKRFTLQKAEEGKLILVCFRAEMMEASEAVTLLGGVIYINRETIRRYF